MLASDSLTIDRFLVVVVVAEVLVDLNTLHSCVQNAGVLGYSDFN